MDPILYWNDVALEANRVSHTDSDKKEQTGPPRSARALAIVHLAMYDAYAAYTRLPGGPASLPPYLSGLAAFPAGAGASGAAAAVAGAAHATLSALFSSQKAFFDQKLAGAWVTGIAGGSGAMDGDTYGRDVAKALLKERQNDPGVGADGYTPSDARGKHRVDPDNPGQGFHAPFYGARSKLFVSRTRFQLNAPPTPGDATYTDALREVRAKGIRPDLEGTLPPPASLGGFAKRTPEETVVGIYWGYDGSAGLGTPPRLYNQIVRAVAVAQNNSTARNASLFAQVNAAMADAGILAWDEKYYHDLWRPVLGVREHDPSFGPAAATGKNTLDPDADPQWLPLGAPSTNARNEEVQVTLKGYPEVSAVVTRVKNATPNFPAYPSGHATFGAAALHVVRRFYNVTAFSDDDNNLFAGLEFVSDEFNGVNKDNAGTVRPRHLREFGGGLWQMIVENGRSRVLLGVHWVFDAFQAKSATDRNPDLPAPADLGVRGKPKNVGGVPLGLAIANDVAGAWAAAGGTTPIAPGAAGPRCC